MRLHLLFSTFAALIVAVPGFAQTPISPGPATILLQEVEVRSGPTMTFFPTSKLYRGDKVEVLRESKEAKGWYEIKPPVGSFSWINGKFVKQMDARHGVVISDAGHPVPVRPGSRLVQQAPNRESTMLDRGTTVVIVAAPMKTSDGDTWLPIEPHSQEVRYLPAEAVQAAKPVTATIGATNNWIPTSNGYTTNPKLAEADQAIAQGNPGRAQQLLQEVQASNASENEKQLATRKLESMRQSPGSPFQTTSNVKPAETRTALSPTPSNLVQADPAKWSGYGRLRETKMQSDNGQPLYTLEDDLGRTIAYVTNVPSQSLRVFVGRMMSVYGPTMYRPDSAVRLRYVVASHVSVP